jgi:uridine phosphorylase
MDAPYRETVEEVRYYQGEGVLTAEMEAAALFAVAKARGVELACAFVISDSFRSGQRYGRTIQPHEEVTSHAPF